MGFSASEGLASGREIRPQDALSNVGISRDWLAEQAKAIGRNVTRSVCIFVSDTLPESSNHRGG